MISSIGAPLQTLGAPNTPLWIVHSEKGTTVFVPSRQRRDGLFVETLAKLNSTKLCSDRSKIEKVPRGIRGEKSSKDMASSRNLVSTIGALASPKMGDGTRCPEG